MSHDALTLLFFAVEAIFCVLLIAGGVNNGKGRRWKVVFAIGASGLLATLAAGVWAGMKAESQRAAAIDRKVTAQIKASERYQDSVAALVQSRTGLRPLSADKRELPSHDNQTVTGVRMESDDDLFVCVLNTRTGPASVTSHCAPLTPAH